MANGGVHRSGGVVERLADLGFVASTLARAGIVAPERPDRSVRALAILKRWGASPGAGYMINAVRSPQRPAIHDERGTLTFAEVDARTNAIARGLAASGIRPGHGVAVLCRNHRGFVEAAIACSKLGADAICMNTSFAGPQIEEVCARERLAGLVYDEEFTEVVAGASASLTSFVAWHGDQEEPPRHPTLEDLVDQHAAGALQPPARSGRIVILTSGTTGLPKGAARQEPSSVGAFAPLFAKIPLRARRTTLIGAPLFHTWGFGHFAFSLSLGSSLVLQRRFDPEQTLAAIGRYRPHTLVVVPVMLQRILDLPTETLRRYDTSSVKLIAVSGSALPGELAVRVMDHFGDVLYNLYGSTEVAWASVASPADLRAAPGTAGTPPRGTVVRLFDEHDREVPQGQTGRIFVGNEMTFEGYTDGGNKAAIDGLLSTGDVGYFDAAGRLFVAGRDDEMIISGGENVFPREIEDLLAGHPAIEEAALLGVEDEQFGQRLRAFVVVRDGHALTEDDVKSYVRDNLARFKVPREVVVLDALPRNPAGKVLKKDLRGEVPASS